MKNKPWEAIHEIYTRMEKLCGRSLYLPEESLYAVREEQLESEERQPEAGYLYSIDDVVRIRAELRNQLDFLRAALAEQYSERDTYMVLFAIVAQIDELIQTNLLRTMNTSWPLLQKELFQIEDAGEVFFEILDDILPKPQTPTFVYEVYFFCIRYGFRGRYESNPVKITEYLKKLQAKLKQEEVELPLAEADERVKFKKFHSPYWNYLIMAGVLLAAYVFFVILGKFH
ncbi:type IV / VI secretion system protein, DotU family [Syntrophus gentianae]|uniref:Type IV / VI secretion system protein, DotU family n=1 Tax=Syntrophus gentianae TaxID=43775 RepID=A0A1H7VJQ0_9BACT|nr:DotU family type IV/VI secretion system protein [Syntrophus gentianae]SEM09456.1 type IV / VI secretion system protein, DotU family [Syntrophus gentianae]